MKCDYRLQLRCSVQLSVGVECICYNQRELNNILVVETVCSNPKYKAVICQIPFLRFVVLITVKMMNSHHLELMFLIVLLFVPRPKKNDKPSHMVLSSVLDHSCSSASSAGKG